MMNKILNDHLKLSAYIEKKIDLPKNSLTLEKELSSINEWDSLAHLSLIMLVEKELKKEINVDKLLKCKTPNQLLSFLKKLDI